jgi:hypothetical protein
MDHFTFSYTNNTQRNIEESNEEIRRRRRRNTLPAIPTGKIFILSKYKVHLVIYTYIFMNIYLN